MGMEFADDFRALRDRPPPDTRARPCDLLGTPLALGSYWGLVPIVATIPFLIWRLFDEERFLAKSLPGDTEYQQRVRRRLVPFVW